MLELSSKGAGVQLLDSIFLPVYKQKDRFYVQRAVSCGYFLNQESGLRFKKVFLLRKAEVSGCQPALRR